MSRDFERSLGVPEGYITGLVRDPGCENKLSHLYKGDFADPGMPMCRYGWNRDDGESYSIFRGNIGRGICKICMRRAKAGLEGVLPQGVTPAQLLEENWKFRELLERGTRLKAESLEQFKKDASEAIDFPYLSPEENAEVEKVLEEGRRERAAAGQ